MLLELSGSDILTALETGVGSFPALEGRFLQVWGVWLRGVVQFQELVNTGACQRACLWLGTSLLSLPRSPMPLLRLAPLHEHRSLE